MSHLALLAADWVRPDIDWHGLAPELILVVGINLVLLVDLWIPAERRWMMASITSSVLLAAFIPVVTLAVTSDGARSMFFDRYVVDNYALVLKAMFVLIAYVVVLLGQTELSEGRYYQGEFYVMLLVSTLGIVMMSSARDLVSIFVALELLSMPAYMMAAWRKRDARSNEAGIKYFLLGVFASGVLLFGMSYLFGIAQSTKLTDIAASFNSDIAGPMVPLQVLGVVFVIAGFGFKISAVPFHTWAPDTYEGAPLPVTAMLSVAAKAAGFVGLVTMLYVAFPQAGGVYEPMLFVLAALTMTVGNVMALRQTHMVRMLAYSSVSQGGFILMPLAVIASGNAAELSLQSVIIYLLIYAFSNLGAFAVIIAVNRSVGTDAIANFGGLMKRNAGLGVAFTIFLASLTGIPPLGLWVAKLISFRAVLAGGDPMAYALAIIAAINTVIAAAYYMKVLREVWMKPVPHGDEASIDAPNPLRLALVLCAIGTIVLGVFPALVTEFADLSGLVGALGE